MLKKPLLLVLAMCFAFTVHAQKRHSCGNVPENADFRGKLSSSPAFEKWLFEESKKLRVEDTDEVYIVPTIYHIIHKGEAVGTGTNVAYAQVLSQNKVLNQDYSRLNADTVNTPAIFKARAASIRIEFRLAEVAPDGTKLAEPGVMRHNISKFGSAINPNTLFTGQIDSLIGTPITKEWLPANYLNHIIVPSAAFRPSEPGKEPTSLLGYAMFPGDSGLKGDESEPTDPTPLAFEVTVTSALGSNYTGDGTFELSPTADRGKTVTHEVGHFFALLHVWGNTASGADNSCLGDDHCSDTPTVRFSNQDHTDCSVVPTKTACPNAEQPMLQNYMDYGPDACQNLFTKDQKIRMRTVMEKSKNRKELPFSKTIRPHYVPADFKASLSSASVQMSWTDKSKNVTNYEVEKAVGSGAFEKIGTINAGTFVYTDASINLSQENSYRVRSTNAAGATEYSNVVKIAPTNIDAPVATAATNIGFFGFTANWNAVSNATGYTVEASTSNSFSSPLIQNTSSTSATYSNLPHSTTYFYRVKANLGTLSSSYSNTIQTGTQVGLEDLSFSKKIGVYPNPTQNFVQIQVDQTLSNQKIKVRLLNLNGQELMNLEDHLEKINDALQKNELSKGIYILEINGKDFTAKKRFIKE